MCITLCVLQKFLNVENSSSEFFTVRTHRQMRASADEFLATVTEVVVHGVYKAVTRSSLGETRRHKACGSKWTLQGWTVVEG